MEKKMETTIIMDYLGDYRVYIGIYYYNFLFTPADFETGSDSRVELRIRR